MKTDPGVAQTMTDKDPASLLNPGFVALTALFFLASSAMAAFFQLQPYLQSVRVSPAWIGFIIGADSLASFIIQPVCAPYLHAGNARRWMVIGLLVMAAALLAYSAGTGLVLLVVIRIVQGAGFVTFLAAMMAGIVASIPQSRSGQGFGVLSLVRLLPYALVPPLVTFLVERSISFPTVLIGFALLISMSPLLLLRPSRSSPAAVGRQKVGAHRSTPLGVKACRDSSPMANSPNPDGPVGIGGAIEGLKDRRMQILILANLLVFVCYTVVFFYISGYGSEAGISGTRLFFTIATAMMIAVRLLGSTVFDRFDKSRPAMVCLAVLAGAFLALPYARGWGFLCLAGVFGLVWGVVMPLLNAMVFDASPPHLRGVNLNLTLVAMQGGFFLGPLAGGLVLAASGYAVLFMLCCPLTLLAMGALLLVRPGNHPSLVVQGTPVQ